MREGRKVRVEGRLWGRGREVDERGYIGDEREGPREEEEVSGAMVLWRIH